MKQVLLKNEPNQNFTFTEGNTEFEITLRALNGIMLISVSANGTPLVTGTKCMPGAPVLSYPHLQKHGEFVFITADGNYPWYKDFEKTCFLYFVSPEELLEAQNG